MNEMTLFSDVESEKISDLTEKTVTTRELAEVLGVEKRTIQETANRLLSANVLSHLETKSVVGGKTFVFDEEQATLIKQEIQKHHNLASRQIDNVSTDTEMMMNIQRDFAWLVQKNKELQAKADSFDRIGNSNGWKTVNEVASLLGYGEKTFFAMLRGLGIFYYVNNCGSKVNMPKRKYIERGYFRTVEQPFEINGINHLYTKIYVSAKGEIWLENKIK